MLSSATYGNRVRSLIHQSKTSFARRITPLLLATAFALSLTQTVNAETIFQIISSAQKSHPAVTGANKLAKAADADRKEARSGYFPAVSLEGNAGFRERNVSEGSNGSTTDLGVTVSQPLFDGFRTKNKLAAANAARDVAGFEIETRQVRVGLDAATVYLDVLRTSEIAAAAERYKAQVDGILAKLDQRAAADGGLRAQVTLGQAQQLEAALAAVAARTQSQLAGSQFMEVVGYKPAHLSPVSLKHLRLPKSATAALQRGTTSHPALKAAASEIRKQKGLYGSARSDLFPEVDLIGRAQLGQDLNDVEGRTHSVFGGVRLTYKFATGGGEHYRTRSAEYRLEAATDEEREIQIKVRRQILEAWAGWQTASESYTLVAQRRTKSRQIVSDYEGQFDAGKRELLDFFFVLSQQYEAEKAEIDARYNNLLSAFQLLAAMGTMPTAG
jgi:adhesin transport system outer membrane protein